MAFPLTPKRGFPLVPDNASAAAGTPWGQTLRDFMSRLDSMVNETTVSTEPPSGTPADGDQWVMYQG